MSGDFIKISGANIPSWKNVNYALRYVKGIGLSRANFLCSMYEISLNTKLSDVSREILDEIRRYIESNFKVEAELDREVSKNIKMLIAIKCYRGTRHKKSLPCRGQRTKTNARTRKGKAKKIMVSGKKVKK